MQDTSASHFFILPSELSKKLDEFLGGGEREGIITEMNLPPLMGEGEGEGEGYAVISVSPCHRNWRNIQH